MSISGVGQNYYQNNVATTKSTKNVNSTEKFALEKTSGTPQNGEQCGGEHIGGGI